MKISKKAVDFFWSFIVLGLAISIFSSPIKDYLGGDPIRIMIAVIFLMILAALSGYIYSLRNREELLAQYGLFKETDKLLSEDLRFQGVNPGEHAKAGYRPYHNIYIPRTAIPLERRDDNLASIDPSQIYSEERLRTFMETSSGLLLIGGPTEGKTRTLFEIIRKLPGFIVIRFEKRPDDTALELLRYKKIVWLVDDLHSLANSENALPSDSSFVSNALLIKINNVSSHCALVGTSRNAGELDKFNFASESVKEFYRLFKLKLVLTRPNDEDFEKVKKVIGNTDTRRFPTIGSIPMKEHFTAMHERFKKMEDHEKNCVLSLILLNEAYIYRMTEFRIKILLNEVFQHENEINGARLRSVLHRLKEEGFIVSVSESGIIHPEAAYITGEEASHYYREGPSPNNKKPEDHMVALAACLLKNKDAEGLNQLAISRFYADQKEFALDLWAQVDIKFRESPEPALREQVAQALVNKGVALRQLGRNDEAIIRYDEVIRRYRDAPEPALHERIAQALVNKGVALRQLGRNDEAITRYDEVIRRYRDAPESALREWVARALVNKGFALGQLGRNHKSITCCDEVDARYRDAPEPVLREQVARALFNKGVALRQLGRNDEETICYDEVIRRYRDAPEPALREWVAKALFNKGGALRQLGRNNEAIACCDEVDARYRDAPELPLLEIAQRAMELREKLRGRGNS